MGKMEGRGTGAQRGMRYQRWALVGRVGLGLSDSDSWGIAPGWYGAAPLALKAFVFPSMVFPSA